MQACSLADIGKFGLSTHDVESLLFIILPRYCPHQPLFTLLWYTVAAELALLAIKHLQVRLSLTSVQVTRS